MQEAHVEDEERYAIAQAMDVSLRGDTTGALQEDEQLLAQAIDASLQDNVAEAAEEEDLRRALEASLLDIRPDNESP